MFENILGQDEVLAPLRADIEGDCLPPALLLSGPPGSGKLTAALELARVLSCARGAGTEAGGARAPWNCACQACARHRLLVHPDLLLLGPRTFPEEIAAGLELLGRSPGPAAAYFFTRAARKLAKRFDAALYQGEETRLAKAAPLLRELEEYLDAVAPEKAAAGALAKGAAESAAKAASAAAKLEAFVPDAPPVFMIRNVETWARLAPMGIRKIVVIENADRMQESSRNALLKILEEPPESVRFALTSSRRSAMMTTILSRVRNYGFARRDGAGTAAVVARIFRSSEPAASVESFLAARRPFPPERARELAVKFLGVALGTASTLPAPLSRLACESGPGGAAILASVLETTKDFGQKDPSMASSFPAFLAALSSALGSLLREEGMDAVGIGLLERIAALVRAAVGEYDTMNRSPGLLAEALMYAIGEAALVAAASPPDARPGEA